MTTTPSDRQFTSVAELATELCWGAWSELGVSGWGRTHREWAIDPEPLILLTASLDKHDPRLRDEATDWCIQNWRFVATQQRRWG